MARTTSRASVRLLLLTVLLTGSTIFAVYNAVLVSFFATDIDNFPYTKRKQHALLLWQLFILKALAKSTFDTVTFNRSENCQCVENYSVN